MADMTELRRRYVALYGEDGVSEEEFAAIENADLDGVVYAYKYIRFVIPEKVDPFKIKRTRVFRPTSITEKVFNQSSIFTVHSRPFREMDDENPEGKLLKWIIKKEYKRDLQHELNQLGVKHSTIFVDLYGVAKHTSWFVENGDYWKDDTSII